MRAYSYTPPCDNCGERIKIGTYGKVGIPDMVGFVCNNGQTVNLCAVCIAALGRMTDDERTEFFNKLEIPIKDGDVDGR